MAAAPKKRSAGNMSSDEKRVHELLAAYGQDVLRGPELCPSCRCTESYIERGDTVCKNCGTIIGRGHISDREEWRDFDDDRGGGDPSRVGRDSDPLLGDMELSTTVAQDSKNQNFARVHHATTSSGASKVTRKLRAAFSVIDRVASRMNLKSDIGNLAKELYKRAIDKESFSSQHSEPYAIAALILACKVMRLSKILGDFFPYTDLSPKKIRKAYKVFTQLKLISNQERKNLAGEAPHISEVNLMGRFGSQLQLSARVIEAAKEIATGMSKHSIAVGREPSTKAGAALWLAISMDLTGESQHLKIKDVARVTAVSTSTIRSVYKNELKPEKHLLVPSSYAVGTPL
jgi:transcription initiation factor TFIIB